MIIDFHCHAGKGDAMTAPWNTDAPLEKYLRRAAVAGIHKTVVFPLFHSDYAEANRAVARIVARSSGRLIGFAFVHTLRDAGRILSIVSYAVRHWGFRGMKIHGFEGMPTREACDTAKQLRIPILVDVGGQAHVIDLFAKEFPDVNFVIPHLGSFADDWRAHERLTEQLARYANVYADTSGVRRFDYIVQAVKRAGPRKLLFGSDGPWLHPGLELHKIRLLGLPRDQEALILGGNAIRLMSRAPIVGQRRLIPELRNKSSIRENSDSSFAVDVGQLQSDAPPGRLVESEL
jgi:uncharacterized protein